MIKVTPAAHEEIVRLLEEQLEDETDVTLRVLLRPG